MNTRIKRTPYEWILEALSIVGIIWAFYPMLYYGDLSGVTIPVHYSISGEIDGWGKRDALWYLPSIALAFYIGLSVLERYPKLLNYPVKVTSDNIDMLHEIGVRLLRNLKFIVILIFAFINNAGYTVALGKSTGIDARIMVLLTVAMFIPLIYFGIKMIKLKK
jgi:hypothetical protein